MPTICSLHYLIYHPQIAPTLSQSPYCKLNCSRLFLTGDISKGRSWWRVTCHLHARRRQCVNEARGFWSTSEIETLHLNMLWMLASLLTMISSLAFLGVGMAPYSSSPSSPRLWRLRFRRRVLRTHNSDRVLQIFLRVTSDSYACATVQLWTTRNYH